MHTIYKGYDFVKNNSVLKENIMDQNTIVLWDQDGIEITFEKIFSIEREGEHYIMLSPVQSGIYSDEEYDEEILVFKIKEDSDHGELLVHLIEDECAARVDKCKNLFESLLGRDFVFVVVY